MQDDEQAIRTLVFTWLEASKAGRTDEVLKLMAEDAVFLMPGRPPMRGRSAFASGQSALEDFSIEASADIQEIRVFGQWAYCWNRLSVEIRPRAGGAPVRRTGDVLSILQKQGGRWVVVRDANMLTVAG